VLLGPPLNVLRLSLHPAGLAARIVNLAEWREHLLVRLERQVETSGDPVLAGLLDELRAYPVDASRRGAAPIDGAVVLVPLQLRGADGTVLSFISTTTMFGTPTEVTLSEVALECFFPADDATAEALRRAAG
jgi:hypothetical protein